MTEVHTRDWWAQIQAGEDPADEGPIFPYWDQRVPPVFEDWQPDPETRLATVLDWGFFIPSLGDALGMLEEYRHSPVYEDAEWAVVTAYRIHGAVEAMARATELADMFAVMYGESAWGWLG